MKNELIYVLRTLKKNIFFTVIKIIGLSIAFMISFLVLLYISHEFSFDTFHDKKENIFKLSYSIKPTNDKTVNTCFFDYSIAKKLKEVIPQINNSSAYRTGWGAIVKFNNHVFKEKIAFAEPDFFQMFSFPLISGNKSNLLESPDEVILTKKLADKLMQDSIADYNKLVGMPIEFLTISDRVFTIAAILDKIPENSSIQYDLLTSYENQRYFGQANDYLGNSSIYIELESLSNLSSIQENIDKSAKAYFADRIKELQSQGKILSSPDCIQFQIHNLTDVYLNNNLFYTYELSGNKNNSIILAIIGLVILITAISNYLLLSFGQVFKRIHQLGILKVFGSTKLQIVKLFWIEALITTLISLFFGFYFFRLALPIFEDLSQHNFNMDLINNWIFPVFTILCLFLLTLLITLALSFAFPNLNPSLLLKKQIKTNKKNIGSKSFVLLQYFITTILIISTIVIVKQISFMKTKSLGFNPNNTIIIELPADFYNSKTKMFKKHLMNSPQIVGITGEDKGFTQNRSTYTVRNEMGENHSIRLLRVHDDYVKTMDIKLLNGEGFSEENLCRENDEVIVNEKFFSVMNMKKEIGAIVNIVSWKKFKVIGIVKDFHFDSMKDNIDPLILIPNTNYERIRWLYVKYQPEQFSEVISLIKKSWNELLPGRDLNYSMLNDHLANRYTEEERWSRILGYVSILTILIASLGLFGQTLMIINRKVKEIGIRKVNGAGVKDILIMLNKQFSIKILIAFIAACPVSYIIMSRWLENFANRIPISLWIYIQAGILLFAISLLTINWQCWNAAKKNPVETLKFED